MVHAWTRTVETLIAESAEVTERCSRCKRDAMVELTAVRETQGPLYTFWNRRPPCPVDGCGDPMFYTAKRPDAGVWPTHMYGGEPGQVAFMEAAWRADRLTSAIGGRMALQLMVGVVRKLTEWGMFTLDERRALVREVVETLPAEMQEHGTWLIEHYLVRGQARPGWR